jgi:ferredoxin-NADP reductase
MPRTTTQLIARTEVAEGTLAFTLARPAGFNFTAGQYITITLPAPLYTDAKGNSRTFSIASAPQEAGGLTFATRMTGSALKRSLAEMPLGSPVSIFGPAGDFVLPADATLPVVCIAGGIGITPFRSMILDAAARRLPHQITLIYSNRNPEGAAYHEELARLAATWPSLRYLPTMTHAEASQPPWYGERRLVNAEFLREYLGDATRQRFYLAGPPGLVVAVTEAVRAAGAPPAHVVAEEFSGYVSKPVEVKPEKPAVRAAFVKVARAADLAPGQVIAVEAAGKPLALCNVAGVFYALAAECPHAGALLSEGELVGQSLICPLHGAAFDVATGAVTEPPADEGVACYAVRVAGGDIEVEI